MEPVSLSAVTRTTGANAALKDGRVDVPGFALRFEEVPVLVHAFRHMVRRRAYDVCEMAFTTYLCARAHGARFTALPVFLVRGLHHGAILHHRGAGLTGPGDLAGRRVAVGRGWTVTTGVWARGILEDEYGLDLDAVTWVRGGDEHVATYVPPTNVTTVAEGQDVAHLLASGALPAGVNVAVDHPDVLPLVPDAQDAGWAALEERGLYPINHLVVVRDELLADHPDLAPALFEAFVRAKQLHVAELAAGPLDGATATDRMLVRVMQITGQDPLPYGIEPNRAMIDELIAHAVRQRIIDDRPDVTELFAFGTHDLAG